MVARKKKAVRKQPTTKAAPKSKRAPRTRLTQQEKIAKKLKRSGELSVDVKGAVYTVVVSTVNNIVTIEGEVIKNNKNHVIFRHKKSKGGSRMRVSHFHKSDIIHLYGNEGEAGYIKVQRPSTLATFKGNISYSDMNTLLVESEVTGEVQSVSLNNPSTIVDIFVDEEAKSGRGKGSKPNRRSKAKPIDEDEFE